VGFVMGLFRIHCELTRFYAKWEVCGIKWLYLLFSFCLMSCQHCLFWFNLPFVITNVCLCLCIHKSSFILILYPPQPCNYLETSCWMADGFTSDLLYFPSKDNTIFINEDLVLSMNRQRKRNVKLSCRRLIGRKELRGWSVRWLQ
jgi:hypothetical protein